MLELGKIMQREWGVSREKGSGQNWRKTSFWGENQGMETTDEIKKKLVKKINQL